MFGKKILIHLASASHPSDPMEDLEEVVASFERGLLNPQFRAGVQMELRAWADRHEQPEPPARWYGMHLTYLQIGEMTAEVFEVATGREPRQDDMHRVNCDQDGTPGHLMCGWCNDHGLPRFQCGCI